MLLTQRVFEDGELIAIFATEDDARDFMLFILARDPSRLSSLQQPTRGQTLCDIYAPLQQ